MSTYLLLHGSWYGAWCWIKLDQELRSRGHVCLTPDLPGHDLTPVKEITFQTYVDSILPMVEGAQGAVTLVGHSFGAMIAQAIGNSEGQDQAIGFSSR
jgi:pimeloyl-ACP methyl ester carboxylesterase